MSFVETRITPIYSEYETCNECFIRLMIYPKDIHPAEISKLLNIEPTSINVVGEIVTNSRGKSREIKNPGWFLSSEGLVDSKDLREHIDWFIKKISPFSENLKKIQEVKNIKMTLKCIWFSKFGHNGPVLWPEQMQALASLNLECSFDIYFLED